MGKLKNIKSGMRVILTAIALFVASVPTFAGWRIVIDRNCIATVGANLASQKLIEGQHNRRLDSIASKKQKVELYTVSMATIKELYKLSMENISGFGTESLYYKEIGSCAFDILKDVPELFETVGRAKFTNKLLCLNELGNLVAETQQLVGDFVNIVNNARVQNPLKGEATAERKSDGYNLLDRYERLTLANRIYTDLTKIRYKVEGMMLMAQYATADDLFFAMTRRAGQRSDHEEPCRQPCPILERAGGFQLLNLKTRAMDYNIKGIGNRKAFFAAFIAIAILSPPVRVSAGVIPKDLPTIEALIALHKAVKKDEDKAMQRVAASFGEQSLITKGAGKFNDVRTTLNTKLDNAHSYLVLAGAISSTANALYRLVKEYKDFTSNTFGHVSKKPFVAWYYTDANLAISREVKHCYKLYASVAASGINLMKASMDEKLNLVMTLKTTIDRARYIIDNANLYCYLITDCGWKPDYIWEILNSEVKDEIAKTIIDKWNKGYES